jgi:hypothetical protein
MTAINTQPAGNGLRLAKIVRSWQSGHCHDIIFLDDFSRASGVQSIQTHTSNNAGTVDIHEVTSVEGAWSPALESEKNQQNRDQIAVVGFLGVTPLIIGCLPTQISQLNFPDDDPKYTNLHINRHDSDFVESTDRFANHTWRHPCYAYLTISSGGMVPDFTGEDVDKEWRITRNTNNNNVWIVAFTAEDIYKWARAEVIPHGSITLEVQFGSKDGVIGSSVTLVKDTITANADKNIHEIAGEDITMDAGKNIRIDAGQNVTVKAGGVVTVQGQSIHLN